MIHVISSNNPKLPSEIHMYIKNHVADGDITDFDRLIGKRDELVLGWVR